MAMEVVMPQLGETVSEGTISVWHSEIGDEVSTKSPLFDVSSDKVEMEVTAPARGTLLEIRVGAGVTVPVGEVVAVIGRPGEEIETAPDLIPTKLETEENIVEGVISKYAVKGSNRDSNGNPLSPAVRRLVAENSLNPIEIIGTGAGGRLKKKDVLAYLSGTGAVKVAQSTLKSVLQKRGDDTEVIPFSNLRKTAAKHMVRSKATSPHVLQAFEADFSRIERVRETVSRSWKEREGFSLTYLPFVARAVCVAIRDFPRVNAEIQGESLIVHRRVNLCIAVDLHFEGLVAPAVKNADRLSMPELARAIRDVSDRARRNTLTPDDFTEGTYTISNSGVFGTMITAPIINQPQVAILSTDGVTKKPVVVENEDGDSIAIRPVGVLAQSFDHRAIDGAYSAAFLHRVREVIETTNWMTIIS
ncbi:MAG: Dihydrolipoyllysine-residue succinyltransferase component of 2-oxoglutarate dehydrogenase complex [Alphaproteobacteria bacterium MarineAlpha11_Bin1]|nr:MAG: Dihydrolipoyllysine-residue succinyltransferase component of 2-oxoglutarate dehydrogenase complex [Alphaproteobacteria bacterium MarineAlpha11_Bin1]|tara:strand:+ start:893 stop:2143 length:1251 start_codon:yes stop_codon:yes gene_type:complete